MGKKEIAYEYIKNAILSYEIKPDSPISESALSEELSMSRSPIREALGKLESEGLVVTYPSRGSFATSLSPYDVEEVYELRLLFEKWAFSRSIYNISDAELDELQKNFEIAYHDSDWVLFHETDRQLHSLIVDRAGRKRLTMFLRSLNQQVERIRLVSAKEPGRSQRSYEEHLQIIDCIRRKDIIKGEEVLDKHLRSVADSAINAAKLQNLGYSL